MVGRRESVLVAAPVARSTPPTRFGRFAVVVPPTLRRESAACCTFSGKPLCRLMTDDTVQPPISRSASLLLFAQRRPVPKGSSTIGARITRCGTSSTLLPYSAAGS